MEIIAPIKEITVGSAVFFEGLPGYQPHDIDVISIMSGWFDDRNTVFRMPVVENGQKKDVFLCKNMTKDEFIEDYLHCDTPMRGNRFLVPEFAEYIGLTIEELKKLRPMFNKMDEKHEYLTAIFRFYLENGEFYLTDDQKNYAFMVYKEKREKK